MGYRLERTKFREIVKKNPGLPSQAKIARSIGLSPRTIYGILKENTPAAISEERKNALARFIGISESDPVFVKTS